MVAELKTIWKRRRWLVIAAAVLVLGTGSFAAVRFASPAPAVPTAEVKRGEFVDYLQLRGSVTALKSMTVAAPFEAGEDLQILKLAKNGAQVKKGDVVVQFDTTKFEQDLAQNRSALKAAEAEIEQTRAQSRIKEEQDLTDVMKAKYDLESAKLDASKQEIVSKIEGEEARLKVADAEQKLHETQEKLKSDQAADAADIEAKKQKSDKALYEVQKAERSVAVLALKAPGDGLVTLMHNWRAGGFFGNAPEFKEGDRAWPGAAILELPDLSTLRVEARIDETDRGRVSLGQTASVRVDAVPDREFAGKADRISPLATMDFSAGWPFPRNFKLELGLDQSDARLRPGMSATVRLAVDRLPGSILIPTEASFQKSGRTVAYVLRGSKFEERAIQVGRRSEGQLLVASGLTPGERVATKDPTEKE
jgi:HlyD family secretion protein